MTIGLLQILKWRGFYYTLIFLIVLFVACLIGWKRYLCGTKQKPAHSVTVTIASLLQVIGLGVTAVSILLPATGALIVYMASLGRGYRETIIPLMFSLLLFGLSLVVGLWNAFDYVVRLGGDKATWNKNYIGYPLFFTLQLVLLVSGAFWIFGALAGGIPVGGAAKPTSQEETSVNQKQERREPMTDNFDRFKNDIKRGLLPGEDQADLETAVKLIVQERVAFLKKKESEEQDFVVGLCGLCIPIPFCPPKEPSYTQQAHALRKERLPGLARDPDLQNRFRGAITAKLKGADPKTTKFHNLDEFIQFETRAGTTQAGRY